MFLKKSDFLETLKTSKQQPIEQRVESCLSFISSKGISISSRETVLLKASLYGFIKYFHRLTAKKSWSHFLRDNQRWLNTNFQYDFTNKTLPKTKASGKTRGRPKISHQARSNKTKMNVARKICLHANFDTQLLIQSTLLSAKRNQDFKLVSKLKNIMTETTIKTFRKMSIDRGLAMFLKLGLSHSQYQSIRNESVKHDSDIFPPLKEIKEAKKSCYPETPINVQADKVSVSFQSLQDHTAKRLVHLQDKMIADYMESKKLDTMSIELVSKYGFDGTNTNSTYHQQLSMGISSNFFAVTTSPLVLRHNSIKLWSNDSPNSYYYVRPISLGFAKETKELNIETDKEMEQLIENLEETVATLSNGKKISIKHTLHLTAIDGKVVTHITGTSSMQNCPVCGATPTQMSEAKNLSNGAFKPKLRALKLGLSALHFRMRAFEAILHIAYRLSFRKWQVRKNDEEAKKATKHKVQEAFHSLFNLHVDFPSSTGAGNTNSGNVSRKAFADPQKFSLATGVDVDLITRLGNIAIAINCNQNIHIENFRQYCLDTAKLYFELYDWYKMPSSLHRTLIHGADIIESFDIPFGMLSEEGAESRNKIYKYDQLKHARKDSMEHNMSDMFNRQLATSDPFIVSFFKKPREESGKEHFNDVVKMLIRWDDDENLEKIDENVV